VAERDAAKHAWDVSVENAATGEVVQVHLDKTTERKEKDPDPAFGDRVVVKYDDHSKHALTFVKDIPIKP
jgi:putative ribosome biogenesis GTPase RsgA